MGQSPNNYFIPQQSLLIQCCFCSWCCGCQTYLIFNNTIISSLTTHDVHTVGSTALKTIDMAFLYWCVTIVTSVCILAPQPLWGKCLLREPPDIDAPPQQTDAGFFLEIGENPKYYEPGQIYTVTLSVSHSNH